MGPEIRRVFIGPPGIWHLGIFLPSQVFFFSLNVSMSKTDLILAPMPLFGQSSVHWDLLFHRSIFRSFSAVGPAEVSSNHMLSQWRIKIAPGDQCYSCFKSLTPFYNGSIAVSSKYQHHAGGAWPRANSHDESVFLLVATQNWNLTFSRKKTLIYPSWG